MCFILDCLPGGGVDLLIIGNLFWFVCTTIFRIRYSSKVKDGQEIIQGLLHE